MKKSLILNFMGLFFLCVVLAICFSPDIMGAELTPDISTTNGGSTASLNDGSHSTFLTFNTGDSITIKSSDGNTISGIYIIWDSPAAPWTLTVESGDISCGQYGFLHEYVSLDTPALTAVINIPQDNMRISDIRIFSEGELPDDVQIWNPPCDKADILIVASHADDDILFFGGIIPTYGVAGDADIQVIYMSEFWSSAKIREHEKLDGLWAAGLNIYPVSGTFPDVYSKDMETAKTQYNFDDMVSFVTCQIRRFEPQIIVTHDQNGEYGHGFHMLTSSAVVTAVEAASDSSQYPDSAAAYGVWNTPKTYLHLYGENKIRLDLRLPIDSMGGRTALQIAADAYKQHVSQQWCWFYVSDDYEYSCADFGLYRTTVGYDTGNDMLENIKTYKEQAAEAESISIAERESLEAAERESLKKAEEESIMESERLSSIEQKEQEELEKNGARFKTTIIICLLIIAAVVLGIIVAKLKRKHR